ncbi:hypothetical protein V1477_009437 [Vespula maculifrons]|uniref:Uncharacterized protein n=1 Tax=Vespula maculifrons TaxID=7453 RepID=A0ABD2C9T6_VESMC
MRKRGLGSRSREKARVMCYEGVIKGNGKVAMELILTNSNPRYSDDSEILAYGMGLESLIRIEYTSEANTQYTAAMGFVE